VEEGGWWKASVKNWQVAGSLVADSPLGELREKNIHRRSGIKCDELTAGNASICEGKKTLAPADTFVSNCDS